MPHPLLSCCRGTGSSPAPEDASAAYQSVVIPPGPPYDPPINAAELRQAFQMLEAAGAELNLDVHLPGTGFHQLIARGLTLPVSADADAAPAPAPRALQDVYERAREIYGAGYRLVRRSTPDWCDRPVRLP